jgi:hypothetical protein
MAEWLLFSSLLRQSKKGIKSCSVWEISDIQQFVLIESVEYQ